METYIVDIEGEPIATGEVNEIIRIDSSYKKKGIRMASIDEKYLVPELKKKNLIS